METSFLKVLGNSLGGKTMLFQGKRSFEENIFYFERIAHLLKSYYYQIHLK